MNIAGIVASAETEIREALKDLPKVKADKLGLDPRAGFVWVDLNGGEIIAFGASKRSLDYYGGFEYVDDGCITTIGAYKIYDSMDDRVADALDNFVEIEEDK